MELGFYGAVRMVTGSCFLLKAAGKRIVIDCGMFQGSNKTERRNFEPFRFSPRSIDFCLLTHGHIDHSGLLPKLARDGFKGPIITTKATSDLLHILLKDSAHIQESDVKWFNRKAIRAGAPTKEPLYVLDDAKAALDQLNPVKHNQEIDLCPGIKVIFRDAGHILGSAFIECYVTENGVAKKLVFSGDLGNTDQAIIRNPEITKAAAVLLIESTYGDRLHKDRSNTLSELNAIFQQAYKEGGNVVIPAFAVGRTQELLYHLHQLHQEGRLPDFNIFLDSPMAISATKVYREHTECFDDQTIRILMSGEGPFSLPNIEYTRLTDRSKAINFTKGPNIIISASGMCTAGRILHHLKHNLWKRNTHVVFVGFQAHGSLGRRLVDGVPRIKIMGEEITVTAKIHTIGGLSAHADQKGLYNWVENLAPSKPLVYVVHGEEDAGAQFAKLIHDDFGLEARLPSWYETARI